jgi:hypothetical protein
VTRQISFSSSPLGSFLGQKAAPSDYHRAHSRPRSTGLPPCP